MAGDDRFKRYPAAGVNVLKGAGPKVGPAKRARSVQKAPGAA